LIFQSGTITPKSLAPLDRNSQKVFNLWCELVSVEKRVKR